MDLQTVGSPALWAGFLGFVLAMLLVDLGVFHRKAHVVGFREALGWSAVWITLALAFGGGVWWVFGPQAGLEYLSGYLVEKALSIDNVFVFVVIFSALGIPAIYQHRVLFWGIITALVLRALMILAGAALLERFHWLIYVFGAFLIWTGVRLLLQRDHEHPEENRWIERLSRWIRSTRNLHGGRFFTVENGRRVATPLFLALLLVEITDVIFAMDSIPAIFAITRDPFLVFTSNIFAILGLRSMFFLLAGLVDRFRYLKVGLSAVLVFVGAKMVLVEVIHVPPAVSLVIIATFLGGSIGLSWFVSRQDEPVSTES